MKYLFTLLIAVCSLLSAAEVSAQSCCKKPERMQALALNASFKASHLAPLPLNYVPQKGKMITFPVTGGPKGNAFFVPADEASDRVLFIFHEWWGLNDYIKREAENWHKALDGKVNVYAIDLYDGKVGSDPDMAGKIMSQLTPKRGEAIIKGAIAEAGKNKRIATLGWCMGGSWSFTASLLAGSEAAGCVMYYGFPEKGDKRISNLKCDVLYIRGDKDEHIKLSDVEQLNKEVEAAGRNFILHRYDAVHAFANPSNPKYDAAATSDAQRKALDFLVEKLMVR
jgi:carboxymethylenebutenolidase